VGSTQNERSPIKSLSLFSFEKSFPVIGNSLVTITPYAALELSSCFLRGKLSRISHTGLDRGRMKNSVLTLSYVVGAVTLLLVVYFLLTGQTGLGGAFLMVGVAAVVALQASPKKSE
jgi:hypothetical protein